MKTQIDTNLSADQLRSVIERIERLTEEKAALAADIRDVYAEAVGNGFDRKAIREIIKLRKLETSEREEQETVLETYMRALKMVPQFEDEESTA
jgi:uncharacterized protein (UPF0335 family)